MPGLQLGAPFLQQLLEMRLIASQRLKNVFANEIIAFAGTQKHQMSDLLLLHVLQKVQRVLT